MTELHVSPTRAGHEGVTGIYVRAIGPDGRWGSFDIAQLDKPSLWAFLTENRPIEWPANCVLLLLGHGHMEVTRHEQPR